MSRRKELDVYKRQVLGVSVRNDTKELTADDDHDVTAQVDITVTALTLDADGRVTGAVADVAEPVSYTHLCV